MHCTAQIFELLSIYAILDESRRVDYMNKLLERPQYLGQLINFRDKNLIKVITGIRRCGKSTLFDLYEEYLKAQGVEDRQKVQKIRQALFPPRRV